jgi:hypothetical protein
MEEFQKKISEAKKKIYIADHMLSTTYNLLNDPKILLAIVDNIHISFTLALSGYLEHERIFKRISHYNKTPESELNFFKLRVYKKEGFDEDYIKTFDKLRDILREHKNSPIEFSRDKSYVIASDKYNLKKITPEDIKKDIKTCKNFLALIEKKI